MCFYQSLKDAHDGLPWYEWEPGLVERDPTVCSPLAQDARRWCRPFMNSCSMRSRLQWQELRAACRAKGIMLIGDVPIFVAQDSADVWANPELYDLDEQGRPLVRGRRAAGLFQRDRAALGQPALSSGTSTPRDDYAWWVSRLRYLLGRVDIVRIDHFRGFEAYWEIPAGSETAATGRWVPGPGQRLLPGHSQGARLDLR